jgi:acetyltransferase-like isoleucine patch superfamily enzyme
MAKARRLMAALIAWLPANGLRCAGYRLIGYRLGRGTRIGLGTVIACTAFETGPGVTVGRGNRFTGPFSATIGCGTFIGRHNRFDCGDVAALPAKAHMHYARRLVIGEEALIHEDHLFDLYGEIRIGDGTWIAGAGSQFWTHGASAMDRDIMIGSGCYLGSAVRMAPGTAIADRCVLGLASVVVSRLDQPDSVLGGFPARRLRAIGPEDGRSFTFSMDAWKSAA